jgi:hypothetical protein
MSHETTPVAVSVEVAGKLLNLSRAAAFRRVADGSLPTLPLAGRKRVSITRLEEIIGRRFTAEEVQHAMQR